MALSDELSHRDLDRLSDIAVFAALPGIQISIRGCWRGNYMVPVNTSMSWLGIVGQRQHILYQAEKELAGFFFKQDV